MFPTTRRAAWILLAILALPTLWLGWQQARTPVDVENRRLKAATGTDAEALAERVTKFGEDHVLLVGFHARGSDLELTPSDQRAIAELAGRVRKLTGVAAVEVLPAPVKTVTLWAVRLRRAAADSEFAATVRSVDAAVRAQCPPGLAVEATGMPAAELAITEAVSAEQGWMVPAIAGVLFAVLLLVYRQLGVAVAAMVPAGLGIAWTGGLFALCGHQLDPIAALLQPVLLTVGVAYSLHLVDGFLRRARRLGGTAAVARTARDLLAPSLLASGTTVLGFLVNAISPIPSIVDFALYAGFGVALTAAAAFWTVPATLLACGVRPRLTREPGRIARSCAGFAARHRVAIVVAATLVFAFAVHQCLHLTVDNDPLRVLPATHPLRLDTDRLAARLGGVELFDVMIEKDSALKQPAALAVFAADLAAREGVAGLAGPPRIARSGELLLSAILPRSGSTAREALFDDLEIDLRARGLDGVRITGSSVQIARDSNRLVRGQLLSLAITLVVLWLVIGIGLRSARLGLVALVPNLLTCLCVYGGMASVGRPVSVASALIGTVMLGLVVDTTIHLLERFLRARRRRASRVVAVASALARAGRPVAVTALVLTAGFSVAAFGRLETTAEFGVLAAVTIAVAFLISLTLLPALLLLRRETQA
jgi:predicted RND superfamily exporter protein